MSDTPTAALVEEAEKITEGVPANWTACSCNKCGLVWALGEMHIATVELETEESDVPQPSREQRRRIMDFMARSRSMIPELVAALRRAEAERDAQHALVLRLRGKLQQSRKESLDRARTVLMLDEDFDEACALGFGLGCMLTNAQWRERDAAERAQRGLKLMQSCLQDEERRVSELTATRDLLTAENARLQKEVATLELLLRGGK